MNPHAPASATIPPAAAALLGLVAAASLLAAGCRTITGGVLDAQDDPAAAADVDAARRASRIPRTLPVEVHFVRHDPRDPAFGADLWNAVDEQALDADLRRRLAANGLRAGVVTGQLPAEIGDRLVPAATIDPAAPEHAGLVRRLQLLPGKRAEVIAATGLADLVLLERGAEGVRGATYRDATALFALEARPVADGRVRIRIVPEVKHGAVRKTWEGEEGLFRLETGQSRRRFDDLDVTVCLPAGGTLLVGTTAGEGAAVGDALLRERSATACARLLVVRPQAPGTDPLFASAVDEPDTAPDGF